jgi:hypothetical protein
MEKTFKKQNGEPIVLDVSEEACMKFGFKPGQQVKHFDAVGVVRGVAPAAEGCSDKLWIEKAKGLVFVPESQLSETKAL